MNDKAEYKIQIDKDIYSVDHPIFSGRELLDIAKKTPIEQFAIYLKVADGPPRRIALDEKVDLREPGVERFLTLPLDQTEGFDGRRDFSLPQPDLDWLSETGLHFELVAENGVLRVVLYGFQVPGGYDRSQVDVNVRIDPGYPDAQIDMVYVHPPLARADGVRSGRSPVTPSMARPGSGGAGTGRRLIPGAPASTTLPPISALSRNGFARELRKG